MPDLMHEKWYINRPDPRLSLQIMTHPMRKPIPLLPVVNQLIIALGKGMPDGFNGLLEVEDQAIFFVNDPCVDLIYSHRDKHCPDRILPANPKVETALREVLREFTRNTAERRDRTLFLRVAQIVSLALLHFGHEDEDVVNALNPWWASFFHFSRLGISTRQIMDEFAKIGLEVSERPAAFFEKYDELIAYPARTVRTAGPWSVENLFGADFFSGGETDTDFQLDVSATLGRMASRSHLSLDKSALIQGFTKDQEDGIAVDDLLKHFNHFTRQFNHPVRAIRFADKQEDGGQRTCFVIADGKKFVELAKRLRLPIDEGFLQESGLLT
jgi:hypothetical protein